MITTCGYVVTFTDGSTAFEKVFKTQDEVDAYLRQVKIDGVTEALRELPVDAEIYYQGSSGVRHHVCLDKYNGLYSDFLFTLEDLAHSLVEREVTSVYVKAFDI